MTDALDFLGCLLPRYAHHLHQLRCHFGSDLILYAALAVGVGFHKRHNFLSGYASLLEPIEKLAKADSATQLSDPSHEPFTIWAHPRPEIGSVTAVDTSTHNNPPWKDNLHLSCHGFYPQGLQPMGQRRIGGNNAAMFSLRTIEHQIITGAINNSAARLLHNQNPRADIPLVNRPER